MNGGAGVGWECGRGWPFEGVTGRVVGMSTPLLELRRVSKVYRPAGGAPPVEVLREASLVVERGESVAIVGPSGSGKTTLLNLMGTLDLADEGTVLVEGRDPRGMSEPELAELRRRLIGFVFQQHHLLPHCSVLENVLVPVLAGRNRTELEQEERAVLLLSRVGLRERMHHLPGRLSGGERQRAAVVRALINGPALILADEPTGALDRASAMEVGRLLADLNGLEDVTLVVVTHSKELASQLGRVVEMKDGRLVDV
jgi:lipoprotein-releasing system ATP-binding protein